ncbi:MAG: hypothetical protein GXO69_07235 [Acidobacteria bacterium]|nr:hypothetical protein [Acidobacteriota bacterium]
MKNILIIDPSIMIHKIVQLAFPETDYQLFLSDNYPPEHIPEAPLSLILLSADLPGQEDVFALGSQLKQQYNCPVLMMIPKFFEFDAGLINRHGLDGTIEKPFTSDTLKEKCSPIFSVSVPMDELDGLSPEELESITEEEFMLSEEDLLDIGEEDLADIDIPDTPPEDEEPVTAEMDSLSAPESLPAETSQESENQPPAPTDTPFEDMGMDEDLDSIDFGDLEDGENLLNEPVPDNAKIIESDSLSEEETVSTTEQELAGIHEESTIPEVAEEAFAGETEKDETDFNDLTEETFPTEEDKTGEEEVLETDNEPIEDFSLTTPETAATGLSEKTEEKEPDFEDMTEESFPQKEEESGEEEVLETDDEPLEEFNVAEPEHKMETPPEVGPRTIREAVAFQGETNIPSPEPEKILEEAQGEPVEELLSEDSPSVTAESPEEEITADEELPDVNFAIEEEPQTVHVDEYKVEQPAVEAEEIAPLDVSHADEDVELIPAPSALSTEGLNSHPKLSDADIRKIAEQVVAMLSDKVVRDIAWEIIPVVAEEVVRGRIRQLENEEVE